MNILDLCKQLTRNLRRTAPLILCAVFMLPVVACTDTQIPNSPTPVPTFTATASPTSTPTLTNTPTSTPSNTPTPEPSPTIEWRCGVDSYNCPDFAGKCEQLDHYWHTCPGDPSRLDRDDDDMPCETQCEK
jgi:hypothetical protein